MDNVEIYELMHAGEALSAGEAAQAESDLVKSPGDSTIRVKLLGYYSKQKFRDKEANVRRITHIAWFVDNQPDNRLFSRLGSILRESDGREAYADLKRRFMVRISRAEVNSTELASAANFFIHEDKYLAENCLLRLKQLEVQNSEWPHELSALYRLWGTGYESCALSEGKAAAKLADSNSYFYKYSSLPELAYFASLYDEATEYSYELLKMSEAQKIDWNYGNAINDAHTVLGLVAIKTGDLNKAKYHLRESTKNAASPQTQSFGPNRQLAAELLDVGETQAVLEHWEQCKTFWTRGKAQIQRWVDTLATGTNPLAYLLPKRRKFFDLTNRPRLAYIHERWDEAKSLSEELLYAAEFHKDDERHFGFAIHVANTVLGQLALKAGELEKAKEYLAKAAAAPYANRLVEHGPDLSLCADLARAGESKCVSDFLSAMKPYWSERIPEPNTTEFIEAAKEGRLDPELLW